MNEEKIDLKNIELLKLINQLRDHIDIERIVGLNADQINDNGISKTFFGYLQKSAQESLALYLCKIFEQQKSRNELNSISGIINSLSSDSISQSQKTDLSAFGNRHGNHDNPADAKSSLNQTLELFSRNHSTTLSRLKTFRDQIGAHSDAKANRNDLPSHAEFESLYEFSYDFYKLISRSIINVYPALIPRKAGPDLMETLKSIGLSNPKIDFPTDQL